MKEILEMFNYADKNKDGKLSYKEFEVMVKPQAPPEVSKPHISDIGLRNQNKTLNIAFSQQLSSNVSVGPPARRCSPRLKNKRLPPTSPRPSCRPRAPSPLGAPWQASPHRPV